MLTRTHSPEDPCSGLAEQACEYHSHRGWWPLSGSGSALMSFSLGTQWKAHVLGYLGANSTSAR